MSMAEEKFVESLSDLTGKVAIVTGGAAGLGLQTTIYLSRLGCKVYVASRNRTKSLSGIESAKSALKGVPKAGPILFHQLDLASIKAAKKSANEFLKLEGRLDIVVCNAGVSMMSLAELSEDGYERLFATNHLGHFAFVARLMGLVERTSKESGDVRIVVTSSLGYKLSSGIDYKALTIAVPGDQTRAWHLPGAFKRYADSKLANIWFTNELSRRLRAKGVMNVYCNSCHPGLAGATNLGRGGFEAIGGWYTEKFLEALMWFGNTNEDSAKTQVFLAASSQVKEKEVSSQYWVPVWSWTNRFVKCQPEELTAIGKDLEGQKRLWDFSEEAIGRAGW